jgi:hypothetical protein
MPRGGISLAVAGAALICVGVAFAARTANPLPGTFSGDYKVTIKVTNAQHSKPTVWVYEVHPTCTNPCHAVSFRERLASANSFPNGVVKNGYDVLSRYGLFIREVTNGRVVHWNAIGKDKYVPNAAGRAHHCVAGEYDYAFNAVPQ